MPRRLHHQDDKNQLSCNKTLRLRLVQENRVQTLPKYRTAYHFPPLTLPHTIDHKFYYSHANQLQHQKQNPELHALAFLAEIVSESEAHAIRPCVTWTDCLGQTPYPIRPHAYRVGYMFQQNILDCHHVQ